MGFPVTATTPAVATALIPATATAPTPSIIPSFLARDIVLHAFTDHCMLLSQQRDRLAIQYDFARSFFQQRVTVNCDQQLTCLQPADQLFHWVNQILARSKPSEADTQRAIDRIVVCDGFAMERLDSKELAYIRNNLQASLQRSLSKVYEIKRHLEQALPDFFKVLMPKELTSIIVDYSIVSHDCQELSPSAPIVRRVRELCPFTARDALLLAEDIFDIKLNHDEAVEAESLAEHFERERCEHACFYGMDFVVSNEKYQKLSSKRFNVMHTSNVDQIKAAKVAITKLKVQKKFAKTKTHSTTTKLNIAESSIKFALAACEVNKLFPSEERIESIIKTALEEKSNKIVHESTEIIKEYAQTILASSKVIEESTRAITKAIMPSIILSQANYDSIIQIEKELKIMVNKLTIIIDKLTEAAKTVKAAAKAEILSRPNYDAFMRGLDETDAKELIKTADNTMKFLEDAKKRSKEESTKAIKAAESAKKEEGLSKRRAEKSAKIKEEAVKELRDATICTIM